MKWLTVTVIFTATVVLLTPLLQEAILSLSLISALDKLAHADNVRPISLYHDVNVGGTKNLIAAADNAGIDKIIVSIQSDSAKLPAGFINDGAGIPFK